MPLNDSTVDPTPLDCYRAHWQEWLTHPERVPPALKETYHAFVSMWSEITAACNGLNPEYELKEIQQKLSPWIPIVCLPLDPHYTAEIHQAWQLLLEYHTIARFAYNPSEPQEVWVPWKRELKKLNMATLWTHPCQTNQKGLFISPGLKVAVVTTKPLMSSPQAASLKKELAQLNLTSPTQLRWMAPACTMYNEAFTKATVDLWGDHNVRELNKLAFWSLVGDEDTHDHSKYMLNIRPRYYGGPSGSPSWALHGASTDSQAIDKARQNMVDWMRSLSESLCDTLSISKEPLQWTDQHIEMIQAYIYATKAVCSIGLLHRRSATRINDLLTYTKQASTLLERSQCPLSNALKQTIQSVEKVMLGKTTHVYVTQTSSRL